MNAPQPRTVAPAQAPAPAVSTSKRKPALFAITALVVVGAIAYGTYYVLKLRHFESTDNAYVQAQLVLVTPQVGGTVTEILADDTDIVQAGQPLVRLDQSDAKLALESAKAQLAQTERQVRTLYTNDNAADANVALRDAEILKAQADVARAEEDVARRRPLVASGAVSGEEMKHAETTLLSARSALAGARSARVASQQAVGSSRALTQGTSVETHPNVLAAQAKVHEAQLALDRTELRAPIAGQVARRNVQLGQRIAAGSPLMTVIPLDRVWVEANFKEVQLRKMRAGQKVELTSDLYGDDIRYTGTVVGLGAGTGSAFALLPAQNATGNWIKVVQRVPVRVKLDPEELSKHPLRVGLSMEATVDVADSSGPGLAPAGAASSPPQAGVNTGTTSGNAPSPNAVAQH